MSVTFSQVPVAGTATYTITASTHFLSLYVNQVQTTLLDNGTTSNPLTLNVGDVLTAGGMMGQVNLIINGQSLPSYTVGDGSATASSSSSSSSVPSMNGVTGKNITVNLNVSVDANGNIDVFGAPAEVLQNVVYADYKMDTKALYDISNDSGLIEFWEPSAFLGDISVDYADDMGMKEAKAKLIAQELEKVLVDGMDATSASPFNADKYKVAGVPVAQYVKHREFGRLALAAYAHYIFGHQAATSAITNDKSFIENMLSISDKGQDLTSAAERYAVWNKTLAIATDVQMWSTSSSATDANIAVRLASAICTKSVVKRVSQATAAAGDLANIVKQVIGQDATRAMSQDNNQLEPDTKQKLRFYAGDKIVVSIKLTPPTVSLGQQGNTNITSGLYDKDAVAAGIQEETYAMVITLA